MPNNGFSFTITQASIGVAAVMLIFTLVAGFIAYTATFLFLFSRMDRGGKAMEIVGILRWPIVILCAAAGGWLGYSFMT